MRLLTRPVCLAVKESSEKPEISTFALGRQIGEGNFSRIVLATYKESNELFALKVIEKQRVKRLRIRHPNIFNEINMEKDVLNKLRHPNIIRLYHTFQVPPAAWCDPQSATLMLTVAGPRELVLLARVPRGRRALDATGA